MYSLKLAVIMASGITLYLSEHYYLNHATCPFPRDRFLLDEHYINIPEMTRKIMILRSLQAEKY
jgi:hypothetical protein